MFLAGCGYTTHSLAPSLEGMSSIYIASFPNNVDFSDEQLGRNKSLYVPLMEVQITNQVIDRFLFDGNLKIAKEGVADLILEGALLNYRRDSLRYDEDEGTEEYRIRIIVSLKLLNARTGDIVWEEGRFVGDATYFTEGPDAKSENTAIDEAIKDLAKRIVDRTIEDW